MPTGKLADPAWREERARKAANARTTLDAHVKAVVDRAPDLTAEQREKLELILGAARGPRQGAEGPAARRGPLRPADGPPR
jgi:hypothetical protein